MAAQREAIFAALFARLQARVTGVKVFSRKLTSFDDVAAADQPAVFLVKGNEDPTPKQGFLPLWKLHADIVVFCRNDASPDAPPSVQLNDLLTDIEAALERQPSEGPIADAPFPNTPGGSSFGTSLGGLCSHCWIAGTVEVGEGAIGDQAIAIIPIEILTTA